jgi:hypothetical protein
MSQTIEQRLLALEAAFAEIKQAKGIRGPAGSIDAAVKNAEAAAHKVVAGAEDRVTNKATASFAKFTDEIARLQAVAAQLRQDVANLQKNLDERIENAVVNHTVQTLEDYGMVSDFDGKRITAN